MILSTAVKMQKYFFFDAKKKWETIFYKEVYFKKHYVAKGLHMRSIEFVFERTFDLR